MVLMNDMNYFSDCKVNVKLNNPWRLAKLESLPNLEGLANSNIRDFLNLKGVDC